MLTNARSIGRAKRGSKFSNRRTLVTSYSPTYTWTLTNSKASFTFTSDPLTGARLASFKDAESDTTWTNSASSLWILNVIEAVAKNPSSSLYPYTKRIDVHPASKYFVPPSPVPVVSNGDKSFTFVWTRVPYNREDSSKTCTVRLTALLEEDSNSLRLSLVVVADQPVGPPTSKSVCISCVHMPHFAFKSSEDEDYDKSTIFSVPLGTGVTYRWPHRHLRSYRFLTESFHIDPDRHRIIHAGQPFGLAPVASTNRANYGNPGWLTMPCMVWGNREDKEGFIIYADDPDGLHAKGWQWFSDDKSIHVRIYDVSDHEIDYYGVGGKNNSDVVYGNSINEIGWDLVIRPFKSPTRWVDWYGFKLYREEQVSRQSWMRPSFYEQYKQGKIDLRDLELPIVYNIFGNLSGNGDDAVSGAQFYQEAYKNVTTPVKTYTPRFGSHMQPVTLNYKPNSGTNPSDYNANYWGWEPWAQHPLGTSYGPNEFRAPDYTGVNSFYKNMFSGMLSGGIQPYTYLVFPFKVTSGSQWTQSISGQDLVVKGYLGHDATYTEIDYYNYAKSSINVTIFGSSYSACLATDPVQEKMVQIGAAMASGACGAYHDTVGSWGRGCYATQHVYGTGATPQVITHPRGYFTHYYNSRQALALSGYKNSLIEHVPDYLPSTGTESLVLAQSAEFPCDANLINGVHTSLFYDVHSPILNTFLGILGSPRRDTISTVGTTAVHNVGIEQPQWLQRCPAFTIAYGDRHMFNYWSTPNFTNAMDFSGTIFALGELSGFNTSTYATVHYPNTHEHRVQEFSSWLALDFYQLRRISISHQSRDYASINPIWSIVNEDHELVATGSQWSGFFDYVKQHFRLMAYEPDYLYHGHNDHPLDDWEVETSDSHVVSRILRRSHSPQLVDPDYTGMGDDRVINFTFRPRTGDSLLVCLSNWFTGQSDFSFDLDPATYSITGAYAVYTLDVHSQEHGTKTLVDVIPANATFSYDTTIEPLDLHVIELVPFTSLTTSFTSDLATSYMDVRYSYGATELSTASLAIGYSYGTVVFGEIAEALEGYKAPMTQQIANNLPQWVAIRNNTAGSGWMFMNSWGMSMEDVLTNTASNLSNIWLLTTDVAQRNAVYRTDIDDREFIVEKPAHNLLFNSAFSIKDSAIHSLPAGWTDYYKGNIALSNRSAITPSSLRVDAAGTIGQTIELDSVLIQNLVASLYVWCNDDSVDVTLVVSLETSDGLTKNYTASINSRSPQWRRLVLPINNVNHRVIRAKFLIRSNVSDYALLAAPQLEIGSNVTEWSKGNLDYLPYITPNTRYNLVQVLSENSERKIPLFGISNERELVAIQIPTRIEVSSIPKVDPGLYASHSAGRKVDFFNNVYDVDWTILNNKILERSNGPTQFDIFNTYDIRDLRFHTPNIYGTREDATVTRTLIASCVRNNLLLVLVREQKNQVAKYVIKAVVPRTPPNQESYLECIADFDLNLNFDEVVGVSQLTEEPLSMGISEKDPNLLVINTSLSNRIYYRLYFDYYFFDSVNNQLYTLENYNGAKIQIL